MNLSFCDFWGGFDHNNNFFTEVFKICTDVHVIPLSHKTDILIYSCFGNDHQGIDRNKTKKIFYTGENIRPNFNDCDYSFTFDFEDYNNRNVRVPLWLLYIDIFQKQTYTNPEYIIPIEFITQPQLYNNFFNKQKKHPCCIINKHLGNKRNELVQSLCTKMEVHGYGGAFNNTIPDGESNKLNLISDFKFHICFENSIQPGYYTEKLLHAKVAGTIPLYYADENVNKDFNTEGFINLNNFNTIDDFIEYVLYVNSNEKIFNKIKNEPLFTIPEKPQQLISEISTFIQKII